MTAVLEKIVSCPTLPSLPAVAIEVLELTRDPNVAIKEIAQVVENDQAIASKVLRTINSSYYGLASPCPTIQRAMGYLGLNTVRSLVLGFSLVDSFKDSADAGGFNLQAHWRRAIYGATGARTTANRACCTDPDEAFIASMLQDVGMLAASVALGDEYNAAIAKANDDHFAVEAIEKERFDFTHSEAGALLAEKWRLPDCMIEAVRHHHHPDRAPSAHRDLVQTVALSALAAESLSVESPQALVSQFKKQGREWFNLPLDGAEDLLSSISEGACELSRLFQLDTGKAPDIGAIMADAQEMQIAAQISIERERQNLESTANELEKESLTDGLTGIANRKRFDAELDKAFEKAGADGMLSVLFMDADKFKSVNDTHGHQAGDAVLVELARRAVEAVGDAGIVCRYGGEEFAVIAPGADRIAGSRIAEVIRKAVEAAPFDLRDVPDCPDELPVTISLGVAAIEDSSRDVFTDPAALLKAADTAVYAAKKGGRNCTRVYNAGKAKQAKAPSRQQREQEQPEQKQQKQQKQQEQEQRPTTSINTNPADSQPTQADNTHITALLVESDPLVRGLLKSTLAGIPNVDTCAVSTADEALELLGLNGAEKARAGLVPDVILCDLRLSDDSGPSLPSRIRESGEHASIPIIVINDEDDIEATRSCATAGASAFLSKQRLANNPAEIIRHCIGFWSMAKVAA